MINRASNDSEWNGESGGLIGAIKKGLETLAEGVGNLASAAVGSNTRFTKLFPAPTWDPGSNGDKVSFKFNLVLINDHFIKARNNYMCVNTIINNNRAI